MNVNLRLKNQPITPHSILNHAIKTFHLEVILYNFIKFGIFQALKIIIKNEHSSLFSKFILNNKLYFISK